MNWLWVIAYFVITSIILYISISKVETDHDRGMTISVIVLTMIFSACFAFVRFPIANGVVRHDSVLDIHEE